MVEVKTLITNLGFMRGALYQLVGDHHVDERAESSRRAAGFHERCVSSRPGQVACGVSVLDRRVPGRPDDHLGADRRFPIRWSEHGGERPREPSALSRILLPANAGRDQCVSSVRNAA